MDSLERLRTLLGVPPDANGRDGFEEAGHRLGIEMPQAVVEVCMLYGDLLISDFMFIFGPRVMVKKGLWMSEFVRDGHPVIPGLVLPDVGGMLHWGHSIEGDKFFLEDRGNGKWTVSVFRRNWGDWCEFDESIDGWLVGVFGGRTAVEWMPEWPSSHWFEGTR
ncbi:hypothetical protein AB0D49_21345 [Streptomyces sp. NPDC048290]|uniref:hypothetical protein n=1 Tax=Streptomyces sp. NPDC048290 TaxID=3155811 RepID=UPI00342AF177